MNEASLKLAVISALRHQPSFQGLQQLQSCNDRQSRRLLRWLDESGLALYFWSRVREHHKTDKLPELLRVQLDRRFDSNRKRSTAILCEISKISEALEKHGVRHAFLKGLSLVPHFCEAIELRHQSDVDILVSSDSLREAGIAMRTLGYFIEEHPRAGEIQVGKPRHTPPSIKDDIYAPVFDLEIDLQTSICENIEHVALTAPTDCLARAEVRQVNQVRFSSLSLEDSFIVQILHAFRHILGSWLRVSWLFEIHSFVVRHSGNGSLWSAVQARVSAHPGLRDVFGLVLALTNQLFHSPMPKIIQSWCLDPLPVPFRQWISEFGVRWSLAGLSGSKLSLLIHAEFIPDPRTRRLYLWRRLFPVKGRPTIGRIESRDKKATLSAQIAQAGFLVRRAFFHAVSLGSFGIDAIRWIRMLHELRGQSALGG